MESQNPSVPVALLASSARSGSTLLANAIQSHPGVAFYNEVITRAPKLMPGIEAAFPDQAEDAADALREDLAAVERFRLSGGRHWLHRNRMLKTGVFALWKLWGNVQRRLGREWSFAHKVIHVNSLQERGLGNFYRSMFRKDAEPTCRLLKEVNLEKAVWAFFHGAPSSPILFLRRNPFSMVDSVIRQRQVKSLDDLSMIWRSYLEGFFGKPELVARWYDAGVVERLALGWRLSNEYALEALAKTTNPVLPLTYEELVSDLETGVGQALAFLGLNKAEETQAYLARVASASSENVHLRSAFQSREKVLERLFRPRLSAEEIDRIAAVVSDSPALASWPDLLGRIAPGKNSG